MRNDQYKPNIKVIKGKHSKGQKGHGTQHIPSTFLQRLYLDTTTNTHMYTQPSSNKPSISARKQWSFVFSMRDSSQYSFGAAHGTSVMSNKAAQEPTNVIMAYYSKTKYFIGTFISGRYSKIRPEVPFMSDDTLKAYISYTPSVCESCLVIPIISTNQTKHSMLDHPIDTFGSKGVYLIDLPTPPAQSAQQLFYTHFQNSTLVELMNRCL